MIFATDPDIQYALSQDEDNSGSFSWKDIVMSEDAPNVFLCLDQSRLEQWSGVIRLMITQLIRQIERHPDKHSFQGSKTKPLLLLLDEFPLLGRMEAITEAMTTLRPKKVTLYIVIQSIAQLDAVYGSDVRKILADNCQYKSILNVTEPDTQEYLSRMIGTVPTAQVSVSHSFAPIPERYKLGRSIKTHDWDAPGRVQEWRAGWANACNVQFRQHWRQQNRGDAP